MLAPAFVTTELREAFAIAVLIFVPFLVIDLVVGLALAALGLQTTSPQIVALPLKLLLFVAVDGWRLLIDALAARLRVTARASSRSCARACCSRCCSRRRCSSRR